MIKGLAKDFILYGIGGALSKASSIILLPFYTFYFSPEEYGVLELLTVIITLSSILGLLQLESALSRFFYEYQDEKRKQLISTLFLFSGLLSFLIALLLWMLGDSINLLIFDSLIYINAYNISLLSLPLFCINSLLIVIVRFTEKKQIFIKSQGLLFLANLIIPVVLVYFFDWGISSFFWGQFFGLLLAVLFISLSSRKEFAATFSIKFIGPSLKYSLPLIPGVASGWINSYGSRFLMISFLSFKEIGIYAVAIKIASIFQLIGSAFRMTWPQFFWKTFKEDKNHKQVFRTIHYWLSLIISAVIIFFTIFVADFASLILTEDYNKAIPYIPMISFSFLIQSFLIQIVGVGPSIKYKTKFNSYAFILGTLLNLITLVIFLPKIGLIAVPISFLISSIASYVALWYFSELLYKINFYKRITILHFLLILSIIFFVLFYSLSLQEKLLLFLASMLILIFISNKITSKIKDFLK
ncbi:oligosaccharide flippase family protein [Flavobacteriaceae bacterium]|nr:oligosaccharide flippase family protein [Flavobacteriaceae bacterium]